MKSLRALENLDFSLNDILSKYEHSNSFLDKERDREVHYITRAIEKELKIDYSVIKKFKPHEKERLTTIYMDYLTKKVDDFNSHYIQLLAWHLIELKIFPTKQGIKTSIFEYSPNLFTRPRYKKILRKTFNLFQKKRISSIKVSYALLLNYLNNYKIVSDLYENTLKGYLKRIRFSEDLDIYFNIQNVITYTYNKTSEQLSLVGLSFPERLLKLKIPPRTLDTVYFSDSWFLWMFEFADLTNKNILKNLNCNYFKICNEDYKKIIMAKIIHNNKINFSSDVEQICLDYIFPLIKSENPFKKDFWDLEYSEKYKRYLDHAWFYIEETFLKNASYKNMVFEAQKK